MRYRIVIFAKELHSWNSKDGECEEVATSEYKKVFSAPSIKEVVKMVEVAYEVNKKDFFDMEDGQYSFNRIEDIDGDIDKDGGYIADYYLQLEVCFSVNLNGERV